MSYVGTWKERSRYENSGELNLNGGPHPGRENDKSRGFSKSSSRMCSSPTSTRTGQSLHPPKKNVSDNDHSMKKCDQILSGKVGIGKSTGRRHHLHLQQIGGSQENGTNHNKENGMMSNGGTRGKHSLSDPSALFARVFHFRSFFGHFAYRQKLMSCMRQGVKTAHLVVRTERVAQTHIFLVRT